MSRLSVALLIATLAVAPLFSQTAMTPQPRIDRKSPALDALIASDATFEKLSDKGRNGYLFKAHNRVLDRSVAIKFYFWADGYRAHVEPQALARVASRSIIEILEASVVGEEWALFVTPFCEQGDVDRYLETNRFGLREALRSSGHYSTACRPCTVKDLCTGT